MVTGLFDIGRGNWSTFIRPYQTYLDYMTLFLQYDINFIVFIQPKGEKFIRKFRRHCLTRTKVYVMQYSDLSMAKYEKNVKNIVNSHKWRDGNELLNNAEGIPEYHIVTNSKTSLLYNATLLDPFHTDYFFWMDSGWGHGHIRYFPTEKIWAPSKLMTDEYREKITVIELRDPEYYRDKMDRFYKVSSTPAFAGGFFGGDKSAIRKLFALETELVVDVIKKGIIDDDQGLLLLSYFKDPKLFHLPQADYFDVFDIFR